MHIIKKADIILFIALVIMGAVFAAPAFFMRNKGDTVKITVNGKEFGAYDLAEDREIKIEKNNHKNVVIIKNGKVWMKESDCKNQICVKTGKISDIRQAIVCLPNRVSVTIGGEEGEYDAVSGK